jgi:hypothetical protein
MLVRGIMVALVVIVAPRFMCSNVVRPDMDFADFYLGIYAAEKGAREDAIRLMQVAATSSCAAAPSWAGFAKAQLARINS